MTSHMITHIPIFSGKMYPTQGILFCAPFTDDALYMEQLGKANFWYYECLVSSPEDE